MIRRLIILLLIVGCGTEPEDCAGVEGGTAVEDDCGVCDGIDGYVAGSCYDCAGVANGTAIEDCLGVCGGDATLAECEALGDMSALQDIINLNNLFPTDTPFYEPTEIGEQTWLNGRLTSLDLSNWSLDTLPNSISNFTALTSLDLSGNALTIIPNEICAIYDSLSTITLTSNSICPPYPECITGEDLDYQNQDECESIGCMDNTACNYDGTVLYSYLNDICWYASEGCDCSFPQYSVADCDGVCNGTSVLSGCDNVCNSTVEVDCAGDCGGTNFDANSDGFCDDWVDLTVTDVDGNIYETVQIGEKLWMASNLKVTHYRDGSDISTGYSASEWIQLSTGAYATYANDPSNANVYGNLYNWYTVDDDRGVCPDGWHVPSKEAYTILIDYLGGAAGGKMKEAGLDHWNSPNTGATNESGFTALPGGLRQEITGGYQFYTTGAFFWSSSEYGSTNAWDISLGYPYSAVYQNYENKKRGCSIRCIQG